MAERTGCPVLLSLWSYVKESFCLLHYNPIVNNVQSIPKTTKVLAGHGWLRNLIFKNSVVLAADNGGAPVVD